MFSSVLSQQFLQEEVSIKKKKNKSENGILIFQAQGDWIIKGSMKEGDKRTISKLKFRAQVHRGRETTKPKERENLCSVLFLWLQCSAGKKKIQKDLQKYSLPFYPRLHKAWMGTMKFRNSKRSKLDNPWKRSELDDLVSSLDNAGYFLKIIKQKVFLPVSN